MFKNNDTTQPIIIRLKEVVARTGLSRTTIYNKLNKKSSQYEFDFPGQIQLGHSSVGWLDVEIDDWINNKIKQRDHLKRQVN